MLSIVSLNVNGFRSCLEKGLLEWIEESGFDFVCLQETKTNESKVPSMLIDSIGYQHFWHHGQRRGYSGVATFSKIAPTNVIAGMGIDKYDSEGRVLRLDFGDLTLLNCYFPNGGSGDERQKFKMQFLNDFYSLTENLLDDRPNLIVVGDLNIAHQKIDLNNPGNHQRTSGHLPEERAWMSDWLQLGLVDSFRKLHPDQQEFTWWRFNVGTREANKGWRLDYQIVSDELTDKIVSVDHWKQVVFSDHCPVVMKINF